MRVYDTFDFVSECVECGAPFKASMYADDDGVTWVFNHGKCLCHDKVEKVYILPPPTIKEEEEEEYDEVDETEEEKWITQCEMEDDEEEEGLLDIDPEKWGEYLSKKFQST